MDDRRFRRDTLLESRYRTLTEAYITALDEVYVPSTLFQEELKKCLEALEAAAAPPDAAPSVAELGKRTLGDPVLRVLDVLQRLLDKVRAHTPVPVSCLHHSLAASCRWPGVNRSFLVRTSSQTFARMSMMRSLHCWALETLSRS